MENEIAKRSLAVEVKWSWDKCRDPQTASVVGSVLHILDAVDSNDLEWSGPPATKQSPINTIYEAIFAQAANSEQETEAIVATLCDWATTSFRAGIRVKKILFFCKSLE